MKKIFNNKGFIAEAGFTLVELLIVLTILAILATIAIAFLKGQIFKGNDARRKGDLDRIKIAVEEYEKDHNCYPLSTIMTCDPGAGLTPYLNKIPCDPINNASYYYEYEDSVCPRWFRIYTKLDYTADPMAMAWCGGPSNNSFNYYVSSPNAPACVSGGTPGSSSGGGGPAPTSPPSGGAPSGSYYGCRGGSCVPISWDYARPGPECDPNYQSSSCYGQCGPPGNECKMWK